MRYLVVLIALLVAACTPDANAAARATRTVHLDKGRLSTAAAP